MLDRVIDAPAHQGRTDLEQALAQAVREEHCFLSLACITKSSSVFIFLGSGCLQLIERCGLLAYSQSCHPLTTWGSAVTVQSPLVVPLQVLTGVHAQLVILAVLTEGCELLSCRQSETSLKPAGLRNKACQFAGLHVVSNGQIQSVKPPRGCNLGSKPSLGQRTPWPGRRGGGFLPPSVPSHTLRVLAFTGRDLSEGKVVTWLILPVVICLSQRLSHACLSINKFVL